LLDRLREAFGLTSVSLLERVSDGEGRPGWNVVASAGENPCSAPEESDTVVPAGEALRLALRGRPLHAEDQRVVGAFAAQAAVVLERSRLAEAAAAAGPLAAVDRMRTALLAAVGHDLRTPLASAKAAVTSLRSHDVEWTSTDREELLLTADESLDRLARLVDNLLDMSRLNAGAMSVFSRPVALDEVVPRALDDLGSSGDGVAVDVPDDLPEVYADPGLLERVLANLVANAVRYSPPGIPPLVTGSRLGDRVELRVVDRGPGIPAAALDKVFAPFQRLGDTDNTVGIGLGLALSRGLTEAMGGELTPEETPGGGLTMVVALPTAAARDDARPTEPGRRERDEQPEPATTEVNR
jgi:two-component system sensor histidine kinase KdpD